MRSSRALLIYLVVVFAGGALLGPQLYFLAKWLGAHFQFAEGLSHNPLHRFVNRAMLVLAVAGIWPLARTMQLKGWSDLGWKMPPGNPGQLGAGLLAGFLSLAAAAAILVAGVHFEFNSVHTASQIVLHIVKAALTAFLVSILEETLFRGVLFGGLRKTQPWMLAAALSSAVYASVHFFGKPPPPESIHWFSGFGTLAGMVQGFSNLDAMIPSLITLFLAGTILALSYHFTGSLAFSIGLHAGWIFWLKSFQFFTSRTLSSIGPKNLLDSWSASLLLMAVLAGLVWWRRPCGVEKRNGA
jgi:uncharacterized protein